MGVALAGRDRAGLHSSKKRTPTHCEHNLRQHTPTRSKPSLPQSTSAVPATGKKRGRGEGKGPKTSKSRRLMMISYLPSRQLSPRRKGRMGWRPQYEPAWSHHCGSRGRGHTHPAATRDRGLARQRRQLHRLCGRPGGATYAWRVLCSRGALSRQLPRHDARASTLWQRS